MNASILEYKEFIDSIVNMRPSLAAHQVRIGIWNLDSSPEDVKINQLLKSLTSSHRELIAEVVQHAVDCALEDLLILLTERGYQISRLGVDLASEPFDSKNYTDFLARSEGKPWPDDRTTLPTTQTPPPLINAPTSTEGLRSLAK